MESSFKNQTFNKKNYTNNLAIQNKSTTTSLKFGVIYLYTEGKAPRKWLLDSEISNEIIEFELFYEPLIREWFTKSSWWNKEWIMNEIHSFIPIWDKRISSSINSLIMNQQNEPISFLQIKIPKRIHKSLTRARQFVTKNCDHIPFTHYCQMQGNMAILNVEICYYIVIGHERFKNMENNEIEPTQIYIEEVKRNRIFWNQTLYPAINLFIS